MSTCGRHAPTRFAARTLRTGGIVAHATEGVFGLAAVAHNQAACARVGRLKRRAGGKSYIVIAAALEQIRHMVCLEVPFVEDIVHSWPGPWSWILPATRQTPKWLCAPDNRVAVRVTAHAQAAALCAYAGPLISTSANLSGQAPARALLTVRRRFGRQIDYYLPGRLGASAGPTTLRDGCTGHIVRA